MENKFENCFGIWTKFFPFPTIIVNTNFKIVFFNESASEKLFLNAMSSLNFEKFIKSDALADMFDFRAELQNIFYAHKEMYIQNVGESSLVGAHFLHLGIEYYLIIIFPNIFKGKYDLLEQKYKAMMKYISDTVIVTDADQKILEISDSFTKSTGYTLDEVIGRYPTILSSGRHDKSFYINMFSQMNTKGFFHGDITDRKKNGEIIHLNSTIVPLKDRYNIIKNYIGISEDLTELQTLKTSLTTSKNKDPLTNVQDRNSFLNILDIKCDLVNIENQLALLFIDLNKFKQVNDTYGHRYGDLVLSIAANRMKKVLRANDLIGRYGGDEFLVLLERVNQESAENIAKKVHEVLSQPYIIDEQVIDFISGSIGIAFAPKDTKEASRLIELADSAMYQAKKKISKERISLVNDQYDKENGHRTIKSELLSALGNNEFYFRIQPIVSSSDHKIIGGEVLSRWLNLYYDEVMPGTFIPLLQSLGFSKRFDLHVLRQVVHMLDRENVQKDFFVNINFSSEMFCDEDFIHILENLLQEKPSINKYIVIEITESTMIANLEQTSENLTKIKEMGFRLAIDDFGVGFSSLSYLKHFTIDFLKVDKSFIDYIDDNQKDIEILRTIVTLAKAIGAKTIVEGVERKEQYDILKLLDVDYIQGYYFHRPLLEENYFSHLRQGF